MNVTRWRWQRVFTYLQFLLESVSGISAWANDEEKRKTEPKPRSYLCGAEKRAARTSFRHQKLSYGVPPLCAQSAGRIVDISCIKTFYDWREACCAHGASNVLVYCLSLWSTFWAGWICPFSALAHRSIADYWLKLIASFFYYPLCTSSRFYIAFKMYYKYFKHTYIPIKGHFCLRVISWLYSRCELDHVSGCKTFIEHAIFSNFRTLNFAGADIRECPCTPPRIAVDCCWYCTHSAVSCYISI